MTFPRRALARWICKSQRTATWVAFWAILLVALAPTTSRLLAWASPASTSWVEVCSSADLHGGALDSAALAASATQERHQPAHKPLDACFYCLFSADRLGPAPHASQHLFSRGDPLALVVEQALFFLAHAPLTTRARGPPSDATPPSWRVPVLTRPPL